MARPVAFFDIDGTVFRSSLLIELVESLVDREIFPKEAILRYQTAYTRWQDRQGTYEEYIAEVVASFMEHIKGVYYGDLADVGKELVHRHKSHVYRYTRDLIKELKREHYYLVAISQSPKTVLDTFCQNYGFNKVYGRLYELGPQDCFTGEMVDLHLIANKSNIVRRVLEKEDVTDRGSVGVGDTESDIPFLEMVERPICFNPNMTLYQQAKRMDWKVVVERKDVIYEL